VNHARLDRLLLLLYATDASHSVLQRICAISCASAAGDGGSMARLDLGRHRILAAPGARAEALETLQLDFAEGPSVDAFTTSRPALEPDLSSQGSHASWPRFAPAALAKGYGAVFAFPLIADGTTLGALGVYSDHSRSITDQQIEDVLVLADLATLALTRPDLDTHVPGVDLRAEPAEPWAHPAVVHNATGMISARLGITVDDAFLRLRAISFAMETRLADVAADVVARRDHSELWSRDD
jgi:signal transduction protein with GAF and PtsI domain